MPNIIKKCPCGCDEKYKSIKIGKYKFIYFTDAGSWWIKFENTNTSYSYSPCQGFTKCEKNGGI